MRKNSIHVMCSMEMYMCTMCMHAYVYTQPISILLLFFPVFLSLSFFFFFY